MNLQSAETSRVVLAGGVTAEIGMESSLAGDAASFIGNGGAARASDRIGSAENELSKVSAYLSSRILLHRVRLRTNGPE